MGFLKDCWKREKIEEEDKDVHTYIRQFASRLKSAWQIAHKALKTSQARSKAIFDQKARQRFLTPGEKVLLLIPADLWKMQLRWQGPFTVIRRFNLNHYLVKVHGGEKKYHVNQLARYNSREAPVLPPSASSEITAAPATTDPSLTVDLSCQRVKDLGCILHHYLTPDLELEPEVLPQEKEARAHHRHQEHQYHQEYGPEGLLRSL